MILRPVKPASPMGPPMTSIPQGLIRNFVSASKYFLGIVMWTTFSMMSFLSSMSLTLSLCCNVDPDGDAGPASNVYSAVTWVLVSGLDHQRLPL